MAIHLVYSHKNKTSTPNVIGWKLLQGLSSIDEVIPHDFYKFYKIIPKEGDVLIGHPHPFPHTVMRRSMKEKGWKRKILIIPYTESIRYVGFIDHCINDADSFLAITGKYWYDRMSESIFKDWLPKTKHINLAVDTNFFPKIKSKFSEKGKRRFLYIGADLPYKNLDYLVAIAKALPSFEFHTIGKVDRKNLVCHGYQDFNSKESQDLLKSFDFMITVGSNDPNPTTILESMGWGLIPVCTPTSGYYNHAGIINIPLNNIQEAKSILLRLQGLENDELLQIQSQGYETIRIKYTWNRFIKEVETEIKSNEVFPKLPAPCMDRIPFSKRQYIEYASKALLLNIRDYLLKT